jgi:hypothetical protein
MTKTTLAIAAAVIAGTTLSSAANAGFRVGFGFPLGSFVAHEHQSYDRDCDRPRRAYRAEPARRPVYVAQPKTYSAPAVAQAKPVAPAVAQAPATDTTKTAKLDSKLTSSTETASANVTEIKKASTDDATPVASTTAILAKAPEDSTNEGSAAKKDASTAEVTETPKTEKVAETKTEADSEAPKSDDQKVAQDTDDKKVCRRITAAIAGLVDVPCESRS